MIFCFFLLAIIPGLINFTKTPISDLLIYYNTYNELYYKNISQITDVVRADYLFYFISSLLAHITNDQEQIFVLFWSSLTYFIYFIALRSFAISLPNYNKKILIGFVFYSLCIGLSFNLSGHLVRQYVAAALLCYATVLYCKSKKIYILCALSAILTHFSAIALAPGLFFAKLNITKKRTFLITVLFISFLIGIFDIIDFIAPLTGYSQSFYALQEISHKLAVYTNDKLDGQISFREVIAIILTTILAFYLYSKSVSKLTSRFILMYIFLVMVLLITRNNDLILYRFSYYYDFFAIIILMIFITNYWHRPIIRILFYVLVLTAPIRFMRIISGDTWVYIDNSYQIIFNTLFSFLHFTPI